MIRNPRILSLFVVMGAILAMLSGCWIPEEFDVTVKVRKDGSYTFTYDGTLTFALALAAAKEGSLGPKDEAELKREGEKIQQDPDFKRVKYMGNGRYKVFVQKTGKPGEPYFFPSREMNVFAIRPEKDGVINISAIRPTKQDINQLRSIGAKMTGLLTVSVGHGLKVIRQNAQSGPKLFGLFGGYKWEIKSPDADPVIMVKPNGDASFLMAHPVLIGIVLAIVLFSAIAVIIAKAGNRRKARSLESRTPDPKGIFCARCGFQNPSDALFCVQCGEPLR